MPAARATPVLINVHSLEDNKPPSQIDSQTGVKPRKTIQATDKLPLVQASLDVPEEGDTVHELPVAKK